MDAISKESFSDSEPRNWLAELEVSFARRAGRTRVAHVEHKGPLRIQRPFYPEDGGRAHLYLLHPPGGIAGGDRLAVRIETQPDSQALLTAPAANKLYRCSTRSCSVSTRLDGTDRSQLEWLPQETIAFSGARADLTTNVHLEEGAKFIGWEILCLGRPAANETFSKGEVRQSFELWREETPLYVDRIAFGGDSDAMFAKWGLGGRCVVGTMLLAGDPQKDVAPDLREVVSRARGGGHAAVTDLRGVTVVRYVGDRVQECWKLFLDVWERTRPVVFGCPAHLPRIWSY